MKDGNSNLRKPMECDCEPNGSQDEFIRRRLALYMSALGIRDYGQIQDFIDQVISSVETKLNTRSRNEFLRRAFEEVIRRLDLYAKESYSLQTLDKKMASSVRSAVLLGPGRRREGLFNQRDCGNNDLEEAQVLNGLPAATPSESPEAMPEQHIHFF